jgi:hypothetical protein
MRESAERSEKCSSKRSLHSPLSQEMERNVFKRIAQEIKLTS